jgi:putative hydrolase of the HAD superfamily
MMVGNSLQSDIVPALKAGAWGIHVPAQFNWELDHDDEPVGLPRYRRIANLSELAPLVAVIA